MKSMTGYGRGEGSQDGLKVTTEVSSVNRKQAEINVYLPRELESLELQVRDEVNRRIARGRLTVKVAIHAGEAFYGGKVQLNVPLAKAYAREIAKLGRELALSDSVSLHILLRAPGVLRTEEEISDAESVWPVVQKALLRALEAMVKMRQREGAHLAADLQARVAAMRKSVEQIRDRAPEMVKRYQEQLRQRIRNAGLELPAADDERLLKEVIYFADRSDISEELTRLASHFKQFADCLKSKEPVGRMLDFLAQEINREVNTIGSKATDNQISREVVRLKAELEKIREQVQNVE
jgi:uncharacterized protein (TIGR00255 family)